MVADLDVSEGKAVITWRLKGVFFLQNSLTKSNRVWNVRTCQQPAEENVLSL